MPRRFANRSDKNPRHRDQRGLAEYHEQVVTWLASLPPLKRRSFLLGVATLAGAAACAPAGTAPSPQASPVPSKPTAAAGPVKGGTFRSSTIADAVSFHPFKTTDGASSAYQDLVFAGGMTRYDPKTLDHIPNMAEKWEISADKLTYNWYLRPDIKWSDGKPLTSEDWLWTFQQAARPENAYPYASVGIEPIAEMTAPEPYRLVVKIKEAIVPGIEQADPVSPLPKHIWEQYDWNDPTKNPEINAPTVGSGPYKLKQWKRDEFIEFTANDTYFRGRPYIDGRIIRIVPDQSVSYEMFKNGELDSGTVPPADFEQAKQNPLLKLYEWQPAAATWGYIGFNLRRPVLQDLHVRRAIAFATKRDAISQVVYNNLTKPMYSLYPDTSWVYNPNVPKYDYDPAKAASELDAAGWKLPTGSKVREKDGQPLRLKLLFGPNSNKQFSDTAVITQQTLGDVGIDVQISSMEWGAYLSALKSPPFDWDLNVGLWSSPIEPHWMFQIWQEENIPDLNAGAYVNKQLEDLFDQASKEFDRDKRKALYGQVQTILATDLPYVFLLYSLGIGFLNKRVHPNEPSPLGIAYEREKWWLEDGK